MIHRSWMSAWVEGPRSEGPRPLWKADGERGWGVGGGVQRFIPKTVLGGQSFIGWKVTYVEALTRVNVRSPP